MSKLDVPLSDARPRCFRKNVIAVQPQLIDCRKLTALTGLRHQELVVVTFDDVRDETLTTLAQKQSRNRRFRATISIVPELHWLIEELRNRYRKPDVTTMLVNSFGSAWSEVGFTGNFGRVRDKAQTVGIDKQGQAIPKRLHDLRGASEGWPDVTAKSIDESHAML